MKKITFLFMIFLLLAVPVKADYFDPFRAVNVDNGLYGKIMLQPKEELGDAFYNPDSFMDQVQKRVDNKKYYAVDYKIGNKDTRFMTKDGDIYLVTDDLESDTNTAVKYIAGYSGSEKNVVARLNEIKLGLESNIYSIANGNDNNDSEFEILYDLPYAEAKYNIGGVKNPVIFAYTFRQMQKSNLPSFDEDRKNKFSNDSFKELIDTIDNGYGNKKSDRLNAIYEDNPANLLAKAQVYMTIAVSELWDGSESKRMEYVRKAWDLVKESEDMMQKDGRESYDNKFYQYLLEYYGQEGIKAFNKQMLILYSTTLLPYITEDEKAKMMKTDYWVKNFLNPIIEKHYPENTEMVYAEINSIL